MPYDTVVEDPDRYFLITIRTRCSRLWFVNNPRLEGRICAYLAKYAEDYGVILLGFILMGNHYHLIARFPRGNRASFLRDFDSIIARLTQTYVKNFDGGTLWARRPKCQMLPNPEDIENWFFYVGLNPVSSGLVQSIAEYPFYNSFSDAIAGRARAHQIFRQKEYNDRKRFKRDVKRSDYISTYSLSFARLPGYEALSRQAYKACMLEKLTQRRAKLVETRRKNGRGFASAALLRATKPGTKPKSTKTSRRDSHRPLVLTLCRETRAFFLSLYFSIVEAYRTASLRYRRGDRTAVFPMGTYAPIVPPSLVT